MRVRERAQDAPGAFFLEFLAAQLASTLAPQALLLMKQQLVVAKRAAAHAHARTQRRRRTHQQQHQPLIAAHTNHTKHNTTTKQHTNNQSKQFPMCDGAHVAHNKATGDNVGPLIVENDA